MRNRDTVLDKIFSPVDASRITMSLNRLSRHDISRLALTGGVAIELHLLMQGAAPGRRGAHDLDFIAQTFDDIPSTLATSLLVRHVHPQDPPSRNMLQAVDAVTAIRVDIFRAYGAEWDRTVPVDLIGIPLRMVPLEDLLARHARLCWNMQEGKPVAAKFARDFLRMLEAADRAMMATVAGLWEEHRKPDMPDDFEYVAEKLQETIRRSPDLLVDPVYSTDIHALCGRCQPVAAFPLADAGEIKSILGYC